VGDHAQIKEVTGGSSYASASDLRLLFGLGKADFVDEIEIKWPTGKTQTEYRVKTNQYFTVIE